MALAYFGSKTARSPQRIGGFSSPMACTKALAKPTSGTIIRTRRKKAEVMTRRPLVNFSSLLKNHPI
jgi:hypothetical protein